MHLCQRLLGPFLTLSSGIRRLQVILEAVQKGEPTAFFCKLGKDRTGLISMLVLSCCGATEDEIVSDYIRCHISAFSPRAFL